MVEIMKSLKGVIIGIGILAVVIVLLSIINNQMKSVSGVACDIGRTFNISADNCYNNTNTSDTVAISHLGTQINTVNTAIATPVTYFSLIVLVIVFVFLLGFLIKKLEGSGKD